MKILLSTLLVLFIFVLMLPARGNAVDLEPFGLIGASVGYEREKLPPTHWGSGSERTVGLPVGAPGARTNVDALGVLPFMWRNFGLQGAVNVGGGARARFGASLGPVYAFDGGMTGFFVNYQHRRLEEKNYFWLNPILALYFEQMNVNLRYSQGIVPDNPRQNANRADVQVVSLPVNQFEATVSYFPPMDLAFVRKDNLELTFGVQVNTYAGSHVHELKGAGVGPVVGVSAMPWQNVEVNLFRFTGDNRSRYKVDSGVRMFFPQGGQKSPSLKELRRKYLPAGPNPVGAFSQAHHDQ